MAYKAVISDFDGTLVGEQVAVTKHLKEKIVRLRKKGLIFSIATGRGLQDDIFTAATRYLELTAPQIIHGGARIVEPISNKILWQENISDDEALELIKLLTDYSIPFIVKKDEFFYTLDGLRDFSYDYTYDFRKLKINDVADIPKIDINARSAKLDLPTAMNLGHFLAKRFENTLFTMVKDDNGRYGFDITSKKASKKTAFIKFCEMLDLYPDEVVVIGDNYNDLPILKEAGLKIAMGNAPAELKKIADYITHIQEENGVGHVLDKFFFT